MIRRLMKCRIAVLPMAFILTVPVNTAAQEIDKEVYVVRPYEPTLSDATKISFLPVTDALETTPPSFIYSITPARLTNGFEPEPIKAAKTVTTSLPKIYNTWIKLGVGNYKTPMAEFNISNLRSKDYAYGAYLYHKSSHGKISLPNDDKVESGYVNNRINLYGKKFYPKTTLSGNLRFDQHAFNYYGYNTALFTDPLPEPDPDSVRQRTYLPGIDVSVQSSYDQAKALNYKVSASYDYFIDRMKYRESNLVVKASLDKDFNGLTGGLDMSLDHSRLKGSADSVSNTIFRIHPYVSKQNTDWKFNLGFEFAADVAEIANYYFYPRAHLDIIIIEDVLVPFVGLSGELEKNSYKNTFAGNPFMVPGISLKNSSSNLIAYGGLKGSISSAVRFRADVSYTVFKNHHFFVNDTLLPLENQFTAVYDDIDLITYHGEISVQPTTRIAFRLDGKYFSYKTFDQAKPWHMPDFRVGMDMTWQFSDKFSAGLDFSVTGNRWVRNYQVADEMARLKPVPDLNLNLNYHHSKLLTVFADFYNLTDRSYMIWNQYPSQRFNFLLGFSYKL